MEKEKETWRGFFEDGQGFHRTVRGSLARPRVFTPEIIQNVAAMGIEKYFMAMFTHRGILPRNHTMQDFVEEMKTCNPLPGDLVELLLYFDSLQSICAIDDIRIIKPGAEDVPRFVEAIDRVAALAEEELSLETRITHV